MSGRKNRPLETRRRSRDKPIHGSSTSADTIDESSALAKVLRFLESSLTPHSGEEGRSGRIAVLCAIGPGAVLMAERILTSYLESSNLELSQRAMTALANVVSTTTPMLSALHGALVHGDPEIRERAFEALQHVGQPAPPHVRSLVADFRANLDRSEHDCINAARALTDIGPWAVAAIPEFCGALSFDWNRGEPYEDDWYDNSSEAQARHNAAWRTVIRDSICGIGPIAIPIQVALVRKGAHPMRLQCIGSVLGGAAVDSLEIALRDSDWCVRKAAVETLAMIGRPGFRAAATLCGMLGCPAEKWDTRAAAAEALSYMAGAASTTIIPALSSALSYEYSRVRMHAASGLSSAGSAAASALPALIPLMRDAEREVRKCAAEAVRVLSSSAVDSTVPAMIDGLADPVIKQACRSGLAQLGLAIRPWFSTLNERLRSPESTIRFEIAELLAGVGELGIEVLVAALQDNDAQVRSHTAIALGYYVEENDEASVISALIESLDDGEDRVIEAISSALVRHSNQAIPALIDDLRKRGAGHFPVLDSVLRRMPLSAEAAQLLLETLRDPVANVRRIAASLLFEREGRCIVSLEMTRDALSNPDAGVRRRATQALATFGLSAVPALVESLWDQDDEVRRSAAEALGKIGKSAIAATTPLSRLLGDQRPEVRKSAADAIACIGPSVCEISQRMKSELVPMHKKLHVFRLVGELLMEDGGDSMSFGKLRTLLEEKYGEEYSAGTLSNYRDDVSEFFRRYRGEPEVEYDYPEQRTTTVNESVDFFDHRQGKPFRILKKGWESWGEIKLYFMLLEVGFQVDAEGSLPGGNEATT